MKIQRLVTATATAMLILSACGSRQEQSEKAPIRVKTEYCTCPVKEFGGSQCYVGIVEEATATAVSFTNMGTVQRIFVSEGQNVNRGQLIAEMDDTQARNLLEGARAAAHQAEDALQRYQLLHERGSLTDAQWVEIQSKVTQARSQLAIAQKNLTDCRLLAPVSGVVGRQPVKVGETAMPSQAIVIILDINTVKVKVAIPEGEIAAIAPDQASRIHVESADLTIAGGRIEKGVQADALTHTYDVRIQVDNKGHKLLPGMVANVSFDTGKDTPVAQFIPVTAVQRCADGSLFVWTVGNEKKAHRTPVTIGQTMGNRVAVLTGIEEDTRVVTEGYQKLSEGTSVIY